VPIVTLILGFVFGGLGGWAGCAFVNEGETQQPFSADDFKLPYLGERFCLQGARGFWSHLESEEGCYDFSMPRDTSVLAAKEGHIVVLHDSQSEQL
jgi:hypothetical protein